MGSSSNQPQEIEEGEAGFALLFPKIDGVKIHTFHFSKDSKNRVFDESKFAEAGMSVFSPLFGLCEVLCCSLRHLVELRVEPTASVLAPFTEHSVTAGLPLLCPFSGELGGTYPKYRSQTASGSERSCSEGALKVLSNF